jgi:ABC-type bacteriocin/lantibiotic exporter with double-glycine peptidase domain
MDNYPNPLNRFWSLLKANNKEIRQIYSLSFFSGLVALTLPLGIQAIINLIQGGEISISFIVLIIIVIAGIILAGTLQVMQLRITENIQQSLFARAAFDFALRIPNIKSEELYKKYAPELMNRFFDITTIQKGLSKILIDFSLATLQIIFGLFLLSLYHPLFILLSITVVVVLYVILKYTSKKGFETSVKESGNKFNVAFWLQELAHARVSFKMAGNANLAGDETDRRVNKYLAARENHYSILKQQMVYLIGFKVFIAACLLSIGGILVINQQMNIGQFVAAELIILLVIGSVEKIILCLETIYDVLTSLEKIGQVSDLELESCNSGLSIDASNPLSMELKDVVFSYPNATNNTIENCNLQISSNSKIAIHGNNGSGKSTLMKLISGQFQIQNGTICYNDLPVGNYKVDSIRMLTGTYINGDELFNGTIEDNISIGRDNVTTNDVLEVIDLLMLKDFIKSLPLGLNTKVFNDGQSFPKSIIQKLLLARAIVHHPKLLLLEDCFDNLTETEKNKIIDYLLSDKFNCTIIAVTNDEYYLSKCNSSYLMKSGTISHA